MKKLSIIVEIDVDDYRGVVNPDILYLVNGMSKENTITENLVSWFKNTLNKNFKVVAWSDKERLAKQAERGRLFKEYIELHKSSLSACINAYNNYDNIPSSIGTDFSLNRVAVKDIDDIKS